MAPYDTLEIWNVQSLKFQQITSLVLGLNLIQKKPPGSIYSHLIQILKSKPSPPDPWPNYKQAQPVFIIKPGSNTPVKPPHCSPFPPFHLLLLLLPLSHPKPPLPTVLPSTSPPSCLSTLHHLIQVPRSI